MDEKAPRPKSYKDKSTEKAHCKAIVTRNYESEECDGIFLSNFPDLSAGGTNKNSTKWISMSSLPK